MGQVSHPIIIGLCVINERHYRIHSKYLDTIIISNYGIASLSYIDSVAILKFDPKATA